MGVAHSYCYILLTVHDSHTLITELLYICVLLVDRKEENKNLIIKSWSLGCHFELVVVSD